MIGPTREHILRMPMNGSHCTMLRAVLISFVAGAPAVAQQGAADAMGDTALAPGAPRGGSEFWIPFGSFVIRGLGQYIHREPWIRPRLYPHGGGGA